MKRSKKKARGNPLKGKSEKATPIVIRAAADTDRGKSLGFGRDKARAAKRTRST